MFLHGLYYLGESGTLKGIVAETGEVLWENHESPGALAEDAFAFDDNGTLFVSGYFGPDLVVISSEGETLGMIDKLDTAYYWPYKVEYLDGGRIRITYEACESSADYDRDAYPLELSVEDVVKNTMSVENSVQDMADLENMEPVLKTIISFRYGVMDEYGLKSMKSLIEQDSDFFQHLMIDYVYYDPNPAKMDISTGYYELEDLIEICYAFIKDFDGTLPDCILNKMEYGKYRVGLSNPGPIAIQYYSHSRNEDGSIDVTYSYQLEMNPPEYFSVRLEPNSFSRSSFLYMYLSAESPT